MRNRELVVYLHGVRVGMLTARRTGKVVFTFDEQYREGQRQTRLSFSLPMAQLRHSEARSTAFFRGLLTDNADLLTGYSDRWHLAGGDLFGILAHLGSDTPGALQILGEGVDPQVAGGVEWITEQDLAERVQNLRDSAIGRATVRDDNGQWSLPGAQAKLALRHQDGRWGIPWGSEPTTHILKPAMPGYLDFDIHESALQTAARALGLSAAETYAHQLRDKSHVLVSVRYDRALLDGQWRRVHQEDLCQALGINPGFKYEIDGGPTIHKIASLLLQLPGDQALQSSLRYYDSLVYNYAIANTDAHAKNYSLLLDGFRATLAPLYDIGSALPYTRPHGHRFRGYQKLHAAVKYGRFRPFTLIDSDDWDRVARLLRLNPKTARTRRIELVARVPHVVQSAYTEIADSVRMADADRFPWAAALADYHSHLRFG